MFCNLHCLVWRPVFTRCIFLVKFGGQYLLCVSVVLVIPGGQQSCFVTILVVHAGHYLCFVYLPSLLNLVSGIHKQTEIFSGWGLGPSEVPSLYTWGRSDYIAVHAVPAASTSLHL